MARRTRILTACAALAALSLAAFTATSLSSAADSQPLTSIGCGRLLALNVGGVSLCTHGNDEFASRRKPQPDPSPSPTPSPTPGAAVCDDGSSGDRVQVLYGYVQGNANRYADMLGPIRSHMARLDSDFNDSAAKTGGTRHVRFVHDATCAVTVEVVALSSAAGNDFGTTIDEVRAAGYNRTDRKYLIEVDANAYCGIGTLFGDDQPGPGNANNTGPSYSRIDTPCQDGDTEAHELMHNLGGVQLSAPRSDGSWHCNVEHDLMCYGGTQTYLCAADQERLFDCLNDNYYAAVPASGGYLQTHWDTASSLWLDGGPIPGPSPSPTPSPTPSRTCLTLIIRICH